MSRTSIVYNSYYQWVPLYLVVLAFLFYLPRMFWLIMEGGLMEFFGKGTTTRFIEDQEEKRDTLVSFFSKNIHNKYNIYFWGFISMESLNWVIVLIQFGLTNVFLHYRFSGYGLDVLSYYRLPEEEQKETKNPMCSTFPRIGKIHLNLVYRIFHFFFLQPAATTGGGALEASRRTSTPSAFSPLTWSTTRCSSSSGGGSSSSPLSGLSGSSTGSSRLCKMFDNKGQTALLVTFHSAGLPQSGSS